MVVWSCLRSSSSADRLLERSARVNEKNGNGSLTALQLIRTNAATISGLSCAGAVILLDHETLIRIPHDATVTRCDGKKHVEVHDFINKILLLSFQPVNRLENFSFPVADDLFGGQILRFVCKIFCFGLW